MGENMIVAIGSMGTLGGHSATNYMGFFQSFAAVAPTAAPTIALAPTVMPLTDFCTQVALNTPVQLCWRVRKTGKERRERKERKEEMEG